MSVGPLYQASNSGQASRWTKLMPSIAATGMNVSLLSKNPADWRNGLRDSCISSKRSCDQLTCYDATAQIEFRVLGKLTQSQNLPHPSC